MKLSHLFTRTPTAIKFNLFVGSGEDFSVVKGRAVVVGRRVGGGGGGAGSDTSNLAKLRISWKTYEMRGRGIFIGVELVRLCASSRKCDSIIEGGGGVRCAGVGWG